MVGGMAVIMNLVGEERGRRMLLCHDMMNGRLKDVD